MMRTRRLDWPRHGRLGIGTGLVGAIVVAALAGPWLGLPSAYQLDVKAMLAPPGASHWLGTDELGRDLLARIVQAGRISLLAAALAASIGLAFGTAIGALSAWCGGWIDLVLMRAMDLLFSLPAMIVAIALIASLGTSIFNAMIAIGIAFIPGFARLARASTASVLRESYILGARAIGMSPARIVWRHVLPNIAPPLITAAASALSAAILLESGLSFLGLGAQPPEPSWGAMLNVGRGFLAQAPGLSIVPGVAIVLTVLGFNLVSDGLRDLNDPRTRG